MNKREANQEMWKARVEEWRASGKSIQAWCKEQNIKKNTLRYWKERGDLHRKSAFVELTDKPSNPSIEIIYNEFRVKVHQHFDAKTLKSCLSLLKTI